jgi:DnaJ-class molecular chaperone
VDDELAEDRKVRIDWIGPNGRPSCPECEGFGYIEDGTEEGVDCGTCSGNGVASQATAEAYFTKERDDMEYEEGVREVIEEHNRHC